MSSKLPINQILLGDAIEQMRLLPDRSIDALISDPPYNTTNLRWDTPIDWAAFWQEADRICKPNAIKALFAQQPFATDLINSNRKAFRYELVWEKPMAMGFLNCNSRPLRCHELILIFCQKWRDNANKVGSTYNPQKTPGKPYRAVRSNDRCQHYGAMRSVVTNNQGDRFPRDVLKFSSVSRGFFNSTGKPGDSPGAFHPTQKPIDLLRWLVLSYSNPGDLILDPFIGSGTTAHACIETDRQFIGIERDSSCHAIALERIAKAQADKRDIEQLQERMAVLGRKISREQAIAALRSAA